MSRLVLEILADNNSLVKGLNQAQTQLDKFMKVSESAGQRLGGGVNQALSAFRGFAGGGADAAAALAGAFVAVTTAAFAMTVQAGKTAEQTEQLAQKTGIAAASLEGMSVALARSGLESGSIAIAVKGLSKEMIGLQQGSAASVKTFQELGIGLEVVEKGTGATLLAIADRFKELPDGAMKAKMAVDLFGRSGLDLIPILNKGAAGLEEAMKKSAEFGLILSDTARGDLTVFDDAMDDLWSALKGFGMQVGAAFAPSLTALVKAFTDMIVFTKNVFNQFADAATVLNIRLAAMVASVQLLAGNLFSLKAFSKAAWEETINHVKAIDTWAAAQIKGVEATRQQESGLGTLAIKQLDAAKAATAHTVTQEQLGRQIVQATQAMQSQEAQLGKAQARKGASIVQNTQADLAIQAQLQAEQGAGQRRLALAAIVDAQMQVQEREAEVRQQEALGRQIVQQTQASQSLVAVEVAAMQLEEEAVRDRYTEEVNAAMKADAQLEGFRAKKIVAESQAAQTAQGFWDRQLGALVNSNAFSVSQITTAWTGGIANAIVNGGNFIDAAWKQTQLSLIQGGLNLAIQFAAQEAMKTTAAGTAAGLYTAIWGGASVAVSGFFAATSAAFTAMVANMVAIMTAVGEFVMGVLAAIADALTSTIFGIPWAGAILVGIALIAAALAATGNLGFKEGGIGDFGSGTQATLHGPEAIIPLNSRGASFMRNAFGGGTGGEITIKVPVSLDGRQIAFATARYQPAAWRNQGAPA